MDLERCAVDDPRTVVHVKHLAMQIGKHDEECRLQGQDRMRGTDSPAVQRWAQRPSGYDVKGRGESVGPRRWADDLADRWRDWWQTSCVGVGDIRDILHNVAECPGEERPKITGEVLTQIIKASNGKTAGADGWSREELCLLPEGFFEAVASIWRIVLQGAVLPPSWKAIRCVGVPKVNGGLRPLLIPSVFWSCGFTALLSKVPAWRDGWAQQGVIGGSGTTAVTGMRIDGSVVPAVPGRRSRRKQEQGHPNGRRYRRCLPPSFEKAPRR